MGHVGVWNEAAEKVLWAVVVSWLGTLRVTSHSTSQDRCAGGVGGGSRPGWRGPAPSSWPSTPLEAQLWHIGNLGLLGPCHFFLSQRYQGRV